ncbi:MAG: hypothetical protein E7L01_10030 [Paenibacillus macerans]|uniref:Uncharacterized protein n=1 Tax=Paenibacillus macerans TaxID=44252 RepID=A0A6N8EU66_PAEMA|nr:DUF6809 family protein [Paenibacillus macerans]MBS5910057.1 hypothetical protein [Paenibacillus macerans]MDU5947615.1 hypothetical protein [Paenibacillus macerans]MDU7473665.1 hypothetical protein [Paenibacillus macerans]MUG23205.1 hypothetical protein [Paenibacillus macerans]UMV49942.1 hypothetical protein LMZ02_11545 [Paenibacillus macerans]
MKSMLEALYCGEIHPEATIVPANPEYRAVNRKLSEAIQMWKEKLSPNEFKQLEVMLDLRLESESLLAAASFVNGFQLGTLMMIDVYSAKDGLGL